MNINEINKVGKTRPQYDYTKKPASKPDPKETDTYIPSTEPKESDIGKTYTRDETTISRLKMEVEKQTQQLRDIVEKLILEQGEKAQEAGSFKIDSQTRIKAQEAISEDGFWGVKQTSGRIFDFAIGLAGGDPAKVQAMKDAFIKGFKQAEEAWGGQLPEISYKTYDATIEMFDNWIENSTMEE